MKKKILRVAMVVLLLLISLYLLQRLLVPKYMTDLEEGALIEEYYMEENKDFDVIFVGDCEVYENFVPLTLWEEYGINSYIRGSAQQLIWQSYYLLEDTLQYEKPKVVVFNVLSMKYNEPQKEAYNRMTLEGMRWSSSKVASIKASMTSKESFLDYVFPILRYHTRILDLGQEDFEYMFKRNLVSQNGYEMQLGVMPVTHIPDPTILGDYSFGDNAYCYLDKMTKLCKDNDIKLLLIKAPSLYPYWYEEWDEQMEQYAAKNELLYINMLDSTEEIGIDYETDTYDAGLHLNLSGAEKLSTYFGEILSTQCDVEDRRGEEELADAWADKKERFNNKKAEKEEEMKENEVEE